MRGGNRIREQAARFARYCDLRDSGMRWVEAMQEIGVHQQAGQRYEKSYRLARGLPSYQDEERAKLRRKYNRWSEPTGGVTP